MPESVAIVGAGVSGLTCGVVFAENGYRTVVFAKEVGQQTTSGVAAAVWFPYDAEPLGKSSIGRCKPLLYLPISLALREPAFQ